MSISKKLRRLPFVLAGLAMGLGVFINVNSSKSVQSVDASVGNYSTNASTYYNDITATSGKQLAAQLHDLITSTHRTYTTYADNGANLYQAETDKYYENGSPVSNYIYEFYSGAKWSSEWVPNNTGGYNREHCWCQSNSVPSGSSSQMWGDSGGGADMHHLRPVEKDLNSTRGNNLYGTVTNRDSYKKYPRMSNGSYSSSLGGYCSGGVFEPIDSKKGDVARIIFYVYLHYNSYSVSSIFGSYGTTNGNGNSSYFASSLLPLTNTVKATSEDKALELLLSWNTSDPVDEIEQRRNNQVAIYQGNRNPFIDNSNYANLIWGNSSGPSVTISQSSASISVGNSVTLTATASNGSAITWSTSNGSVATVSNGVVTGVAAGSATITASATISGNTYSATCLVTVTSSGGSSGGNSDFTLVTSNSTLSNSDKVVIAMDQTGTNLDGVTGWNNSNDATVSTSSADWMQYTVGSASSSGFTLKDETANQYVASPTGNHFKYSATAGTVSVDSDGKFVCNSRYLCKNGTFYRCYTSVGSYVPFYIYKVNTSSSSATLSSITVSGYNSSFVEGDTFAFGGTVTAHYSDNSTSNVNAQATFSGYDMTSIGSQTVTVSYGGKTATYQITVNKGTLSSISVSGYTTSYSKGDSFSFDGVCTATFANGYQKNVTPTSVSSPDMSTSGNQTVTISYTYNNVTKTTSYEIVVSSNRTVIETSSSTGYVLIGTISYPANAESVSDSSLTTSKSGYTAIEENSLRLGSGSNTGSITVTSSTTNITKVVANVKAYGSDSSVSFTIDGTSNTLTSSYSDYSKVFNSAVKTVTFATTTNKKRANIQTISVYKTGTVTIEEDISNTSDCLGLESFISSYMHMDYTQNLGYCKDNTHHYYSTAKSAFNSLNAHQRSLFVNNSAYATEWARLSAWATANGETINSNNQLAQGANTSILPVALKQNNSIILLVILSMISVSSIGASLYIRKKRSK